MKSDNELTEQIIGCAIKIHTKLGPGLLESSYQECLYYLLAKEGLLVEKEVSLPLVFEELELKSKYRIDLLVEEQIIIEVKAIEAIAPIHTSQILTYLRLSGYQVGLLLNFNVVRLKDGIKRVVNY